jgi:Tfp pilus assembly protein PilO
LFPPGGSAEELEQQRISLQSQLKTRQATLEQTREHAAAVEKGRSEGDQFLSGYFLSSRTAFSSVLSQLEAAASQSKIKQRERGFTTEPIEGSDSLSMMSIMAAYEGTYGDLMHFVHELDRSPSLLIIESLTAAPLANSTALTVSVKLDTFVRDEGPPSP